ncbi:MAG: hypothetical protein J3Q66DRAFT_397828 [Benniella sp.]|nr:MAG: hypothetical protein J3Q66DRAFT_397828 [Benniella sp.]
MWKCFGLSEQEVRKVLEDAKDRFHKDTKQVANLTPEQCDEALSDAVNTLDQVKKKSHGTLKKDHALRGEILDACSKLKKLQALKVNKVQMTLKFAEEWRNGLFTNNAPRSRIRLNIPDRILPQPSDIGSLKSTGNTLRSSKDSWDIPSHDQIREADNAPRSDGIVAHDGNQSASSSPGSSRSDLNAPCIIQSYKDGGIPRTRQSTDSSTVMEGISGVPFSKEFDTPERFTGVNSYALPRTAYPTENIITDTQHIFTKNVHPAAVDFKPPKVGERLSSIPQLVTCLVLLRETLSPKDILDSAARQWFEDTTANADEQERLKGLAVDVIRVFKSDKAKDARIVAEVVYLAPVLERDEFQELIDMFDDGNNRPDPHQFDGLAQLIRGASAGYLDVNDFYKILGVLSIRLNDLLQQSPQHIYQFTLTASHVLDAMADTKVSGLDREKLYEALSPYLNSLKESSQPHLVYQAAYAYQALQCVPIDETLWQEVFRRTGKEIQEVSGLMSTLKEPDLNGFIDGLKDIQQGISGTLEDMQLTSPFVEALKEGPSFERKTAWYPALRGADVLIREGQFVSFKKLVGEAPCRLDPVFQWGVCQRLGEIAVNRSWDPDTRRSAIALLGEIYRNDAESGQQASIKQWILSILVQLSSLPENEIQAAKALLEDLKTDGDAKKQDLYRVSTDIDPSPYLLNVVPSTPISSILLDEAQKSRNRIHTECGVVWSCAYSPNGELFAVGLGRGKIGIYGTSNWERIQTLTGHDGEVYGVVFSPTSGRIASGGSDTAVKLWDVETGSMLRTLTGHVGPVYCIAYSPQRDQVACGCNDSVRIWDADTGDCLQMLYGHRNAIHSVAYSPDGDRVASGSGDKSIRLWDVKTGECVSVLQGHDGWVRGIAYSPRGNRIASTGDDKTIRVWDADTGMRLSIQVGYNGWSVSFSPNSYTLACGFEYGTVVWDIESNSCHTLTGHSSYVNSVVYSPSGDQLASGSRDGTVRLWDTDAI